ncbi:MAG: hypothetical protein AVDCRST_MAG08-390, partial [uncultured Acetobacteraceae bacterium]
EARPAARPLASVLRHDQSDFPEARAVARGIAGQEQQAGHGRV